MKTPFHKKSIQLLIYISSILLFLGFLFLAIANFYSSTYLTILSSITSLLTIVLLIANIVSGTFSDKVEINQSGVHLKRKKNTYHMEWKHINMIAVSEYGLGKASKRVVFSSKYNKDILRLVYPYSSLSNNLLFLVNRKGLIKEIEKYYKGEIINKGKNSY